MMDINRIDKVCAEFCKLWHMYPDMRFGQLIWLIFGKMDIFYMEDDEVIEFFSRQENLHYKEEREAEKWRQQRNRSAV